MEMKKDGKEAHSSKNNSWIPVIILAIVGAILLKEGKSWYFVPWGFCIYFLAGILLFPPILKPAEKFANIISKLIGWIAVNIILTLIYFLLITPIALWFRIKGRDRLNLKYPDDAKSFWHKRSPEEQMPSCEKQY
jgi:hypothetical protein